MRNVMAECCRGVYRVLPRGGLHTDAGQYALRFQTLDYIAQKAKKILDLASKQKCSLFMSYLNSNSTS